MARKVLTSLMCAMAAVLCNGCSCEMSKKEKEMSQAADSRGTAGTTQAPAGDKVNTTNQGKEMQTTASGLQYQVLQPADAGAKKPAAGKKVKVNYTGWLDENGAPGKKFDSSYDHGAPFEFIIGSGSVIKGWDEGVMMMSVGEKTRLIIPGNLAYGSRGYPGVIPGNATLIFDVELLGVE